jgi:carbon-monoxide dehydrogenase iron sulfur subunit
VKKLTEKILLVNPEKCTGCRICELACSFAKNRLFNPTKSRIKILNVEKYGIRCPIVCAHCEQPPCKVVCPVEAIVRDEKTGAILIRDNVCIGCRACLIVCPYGAISMDSATGLMIKCDLCGGEPKCVKLCPTGAIRYVRAETADMPIKRAMMEKITEAILESRKNISKVS